MKSMEQLTPADSAGLVVLESQIRECFGRTVYSHKAHEKTADIYLRRLSKTKFYQIALSAITTGGLIATLLDQGSWAAAISAIVSTVLLALNTYTKDLDLGQTAEKHKETAAKLWAVRESYLSILTDIRAMALSAENIRDRRDKLQIRLERIYSTAPRTLPEAYKEAGIALKEREELTFNDAEIDKFLPAALRRPD